MSATVPDEFKQTPTPATAEAASGRILVDTILRDKTPRNAEPAVHEDGYPNLFAATAYPGGNLIPFTSGISWIKPVGAPDGLRVPALIIASSPHKVGRAETPWEDTFDSDRGYIRYFGDNKKPGDDPAQVRGNSFLLQQLELHASPDIAQRRRAVPLVFFRRLTVDGTPKGYPQFKGFGTLRRAELVVQLDKHGVPFTNYVYECAVLSLAPEHEIFDWTWVNARRDPKLTLTETEALAPTAWREWVKHGDEAFPRVRRDVQRLRIRKTADQRPPKGSRDERLLKELYAHYKGQEVKFEAVAAWLTERHLNAGGIYRHHGITRASGDHGFDFIGSLDLGTGFGSVRVVVLGQAKCEKLSDATNAVHIARTVARLRRGWIGVYVTTSYFSEPTQAEILEDKYPILLIDGATVAASLAAFLLERRTGLAVALTEIESSYGNLTEVTDPDQLTFSGWPVAPGGSPK